MAKLLQITLVIAMAAHMAGAQRHQMGCAGQWLGGEACISAGLLK